MHVLLSHPYFWPHVRRGAEREVHDVGQRLVERGHRVDLLTGQPSGVTSRTTVDGVRVRYVRTPLPGSLARRGVTREAVFGGLVAVGSAVSRADVVVSYHYADAVGAHLARPRRPLVLKLTGAVPRSYAEAHASRVQQALLRRGMAAADEVWVNSAYVVEAMADWDVPMHVLPAGVDERTFVRCAERDPEPLVVCTAAPDDPRKRLVDLLDGWRLVREALPTARLVLAQRAGPAVEAELRARLHPEDADSIELVGQLDGPDLAKLCSQAWVVVAPALHEALGLATLEALACGTPVAGAHSGATPQLLDAPGTGALFEPADLAALAAAVVEAAALAELPQTAARCREAALRYAWPTVITQVDERLGRLVSGSRAP